MLSTRDPPQNRGYIQTESEELEKIFHANRHQKKAGVGYSYQIKYTLKQRLWKETKTVTT